MASSDILSQTLDSITATKLDEISKQRSRFEEAKADILQRVKGETVQQQRVRILLDGIEDLRLVGKLGGKGALSHQNIRQFLFQSFHDPSVSLKQQKQWESELIHELNIQSRRFEYASLYAGLVTEWLSPPERKSNGIEDSSFEKLGRKEMHEQRATWEAYVFKPLSTDTSKITSYLESLFCATKKIKQALQELRVRTNEFETTLDNDTPFDDESLKWCIDGLLASDLLTDVKRSVLLDFSNNKVVLRELADVLNMRFKALDTWKWAEEGTLVEQRRQLNGRYRFYHDEDLLQSIFLRFIGVRWSVHFKNALTTFMEADEVWKSSLTSVTKVDKQRREHFLDRKCVMTNSVQAKRKDLWESDVFLEQLQSEVEEANLYDDSNHASYNDRGAGRQTPQQVTQSVLHLLVTDIIIKTRLGEDVTVVHSDFKWFGPSLPHSTMFAVLRFFGVSGKWVDFFRRALEAPMKFLDDGHDAPVQIRKRGTPISGPLSDMLGETVLFCLDFGVNQRTGGALLFRLHDDIWFWGNEKTCEVGWETMTEFTKIMGLEMNETKTGSVKVSRKSKGNKPKATSALLPRGDVRWGFLKLDAVTGRFIIDQEDVGKHISELRLQLDACRSVFDWIQAWNVYASRFFTVNFGQPAICNGQAHVDMMLETFERIQSELFKSSENSSVTATVKDMISKRFGVHDIPEGFLYFPLAQGGLDLRSPFIGLYLIRSSLISDSNLAMNTFFEDEEAAYQRDKRLYENRTHHRYGNKDEIAPDGQFMSFEEYTKYREQTSQELAKAYEWLMRGPDEHSVELTSDVSSAVEQGIWDKKWPDMNAYDRWLLQLYGSDMIAQFGGLNVIDKGLLPTGMVSMFRKSRFQWAG